MKGKVIGLLVLLIFIDLRVFAQGSWKDLSSSLKEVDIRSAAVDPKDPSTLFAGSEKNLYRSLDQGRTWKNIFKIGGSENRIHCLFIDTANSKTIYVGTAEGIQRSEDGGGRFSLFFNGVKNGTKQIFCIAQNPSNPKEIWAGTGNGLISIDKRTRAPKKLSSLPDASVYSLMAEGLPEKTALAATDKGIFKSADSGVSWEKVYTDVDAPEEAEEPYSLTANSQFGVEEAINPLVFSGFIFMPKENRLYAGSKNGILQSALPGDSWQSMRDQNMPSRRINAVTNSRDTFYVATHKGVFRWNAQTENFSSMYKGLLSEDVRALSYSADGDYLLAGTERGLFQWIHPDADIPGIKIEQSVSKEMSGFKDRFKSEPTIREIQEVAIRYAEVHPKKIEEWRVAASRKAILPSVSLGGKLASDNNVDIDRGGTSDVDKFIIGPENKSFDWSVGLSWDLGDLIWNDDQTSIDSRSKLMVELRDDILNEVTHLYFERRRLQVDLLTLPDSDIPVLIEKEIRLEELTAGIDALTGGYLSSRLEGRGI